ncbi:MAG: hypothetical protein Q7R47_06240 [Candidatus Diapherotrites archaeon]|nr:hypothetical protein [Candidatus Diapherotrites archaeon]
MAGHGILQDAIRETHATIREKFKAARKDRRLIALLAIEFVLVLVLVGALVVYLNPAVNLPAMLNTSIELRIFLFILLVGAVLYLYRFTADYRHARNDQWLATKEKIVKKKRA